MLFQDAHTLIVHGKPDSGSKSAHTRSDDDRVEVGASLGVSGL